MPDLGGSCWTDNGFEYEERSLVFSVIIPVYNVEKYIINYLEPVLQQRISFPYKVHASKDRCEQMILENIYWRVNGHADRTPGYGGL